jgi:hypothetical protein
VSFIRRKGWHPGFASWYAGLSRNDRARYWVGRWGNAWDEWLCEQPSWLSDQDWLYYFDGGWSRAACILLGHYPTPDHCGIPAHDYCSTCSKSMPNAVSRTA